MLEAAREEPDVCAPTLGDEEERTVRALNAQAGQVRVPIATAANACNPGLLGALPVEQAVANAALAHRLGNVMVGVEVRQAVDGVARP